MNHNKQFTVLIVTFMLTVIFSMIAFNVYLFTVTKF
jgi:hypothetical protein